MTYAEHHRALQVRIDRQRAGRVAASADWRRAAAVLGVHGAAVDLPRQAAGRLRVARLRLEPGKDLPIGVSRRRPARRRPGGLNCAVCHTSTVRDRTDATPTDRARHAGAAARSPGFVQFVLDCTLDNRLTADAIRGRLPTARRTVALRAGAVADGTDRSAEDSDARAAQPHRADSRPTTCRAGAAGRVDTFNPYKAIQFNWDSISCRPAS